MNAYLESRGVNLWVRVVIVIIEAKSTFDINYSQDQKIPRSRIDTVRSVLTKRHIIAMNHNAVCI